MARASGIFSIVGGVGGLIAPVFMGKLHLRSGMKIRRRISLQLLLGNVDNWSNCVSGSHPKEKEIFGSIKIILKI